MSKSADNTPAPSTLDEESDVIELTEEVQAGMSPDEEDPGLESLGLEMPEFKVPGSNDEPPVADKANESQEVTTQRLSAEALREANFADNRAFVDSEPESSDEEPQYDRQAMVKTIQMDAVDRSTLESMGQRRADRDEDLLTNARFSPEIVAGPPDVLVKKWREGLPGSVISIVGESPKTKEVQDRPVNEPKTMPDLPTDPQSSEDDVLESAEEDDVLESAEENDALDESSEIEVVQESDEALELEMGTEAIELDEELIEFDEEESSEAEILERAAEPPEITEAIPQQPAPVKEKKEDKAEGGDSEMKGLVKELLDERKEGKETQTKRLRPRDIWFQELFSEEYLRTIPPNIEELTDLESNFIEKSLKLKKKSRILDLACGFGRHSIELADRGYEMVGLDLSMPLLQRALATAQERSLNVKFIHGDMRELSFSGLFDGCFIWDTSLGYFDDRMNLRVLQGVQRGLKTGGRVLVDVINRDYVVRQTPTRLWWEGKGCIFLEESEFDYQTSTLHSKRSFIYEDGTPPLEQNSYVRLYNAHELRQMLHVAGFKVLEVSGERHHKGYFLGTASSRIIVLAEKRVKKSKPTSK